MKVAVIGAGIVGVSTAWELRADGHDVDVFERRGSVAAEASFAHGGLVAPGWLAPWTVAAPRWRLADALAALRWRLGRRAGADAQRRLLPLARASRQRLRELAHELRIDYERADGVLVPLRTPADARAARPTLRLLAELGVNFHLVDAAQCRRIETGLHAEAPLHAGIHLADAEVGNCRAFAHALRSEAERRGVRFHFHREAVALDAGTRPRLSWRAVEPTQLSRLVDTAGDRDPAPREFEAVVVCAALDARRLLEPLGVKLPLVPLYGHSITAPLRSFEAWPEALPRAALYDPRTQVSISRIGNRVRVAGGAELGRSDERSVAALYRTLHDWFPGIAQLDQALRWRAPRALLPGRLPVVGASGRPGLWLNVGHGAAGWALASGCARLLADSLAGRAVEPAFSLDAR